MRDAIDVLELGFREWGAGEAIMSAARKSGAGQEVSMRDGVKKKRAFAEFNLSRGC